MRFEKNNIYGVKPVYLGKINDPSGELHALQGEITSIMVDKDNGEVYGLLVHGIKAEVQTYLIIKIMVDKLKGNLVHSTVDAKYLDTLFYEEDAYVIFYAPITISETTSKEFPNLLTKKTLLNFWDKILKLIVGLATIVLLALGLYIPTIIMLGISIIITIILKTKENKYNV